MKTRLLLLTACICFTVCLTAQAPKERAALLALGFNKQKEKQKEKNGLTSVSNKTVEAVPDIRSSISEYEGNYEIPGLGQFITLSRSTGNTLEAVFTDSKKNTTGTLKNIQIEAGLLLASMQYANGGTVPFEAVFLSRTENGEKSGGIGIKQLITLSSGFIFDKAFYRKVE